MLVITATICSTWKKNRSNVRTAGNTVFGQLMKRNSANLKCGWQREVEKVGAALFELHPVL